MWEWGLSERISFKDILVTLTEYIQAHTLNTISYISALSKKVQQCKQLDIKEQN